MSDSPLEGGAGRRGMFLNLMILPQKASHKSNKKMPHITARHFFLWAHLGLNQGHLDYESSTLTS